VIGNCQSKNRRLAIVNRMTLAVIQAAQLTIVDWRFFDWQLPHIDHRCAVVVIDVQVIFFLS